ncbi:hypothetical protein FACS1894191_5250 [Clostridia bacterium]|nr:hypothetical protein FACS1894191_5250 [Clostridia bacterium]
MANITNSYETVMIFNTQTGEEGIKALYEKFRALIAENGTIDSEEDWGKRRLAYPIMDEIEGYYYMVRFTGSTEFPAELDRVYKITDGVLRTMIIRIEKEEAKPEKPVEAAAEKPETAVAAEAAETTEQADGAAE